MNKNTTYIIVAVIVVIIIVAGAAAFLLMNNGNGGTSPTATPTATASPTVEGVSTLQFDVAETTSGVTLNYQFSAKNMNSDTEHLVVRMDILDASGNYFYIVDTGAEKSWLSMDDGATWTESTTYADDYAMVVDAFNGYVEQLTGHWTGGDYTYTNTAGSEIVISNITPDATLPDSTFATS